MCAQSQEQPYSRMKHALISAYGSQWSNRHLAMFTVYLDDSGTDPNQKVAIASALLIPANRLLSLEREWKNLCDKESFACFHSSEAVHRNPKSEFADWKDDKLYRTVRRIREISKKYGTKVFSIAVNKSDYDDDSVVHPELRELGGRYHYTWAVRSVVSAFSAWSDERGRIPIEYVFDFMDSKTQKQAKLEIETVMEQAEQLNPGRFEGHYSFRKRCEVPSLQCTDLIAWSCFQFAQHKFSQNPLHPVAKESFEDYDKKGNDWFLAVAHTRAQLARWSVREYADPGAIKRRQEWKEKRTMEPIPPRPYDALPQ
jgi:hypothetical protein